MSCWSAEGTKSYQYAAYAEEKKRFLLLGVVKLAWYHTMMLMHTHRHTRAAHKHARLAMFLTKGNQNKTVTTGCQAFRDRSQMHRALKGASTRMQRAVSLRRNLEHVRHTCQEANRYTGACSAYIQIWPLIRRYNTSPREQIHLKKNVNKPPAQHAALKQNLKSN